MVGTPKKPFSLSTTAAILGLELEEVRELMRSGVLTAFDPGIRTKPHKGRYKKWHFDPGEVAAYLDGKIEGVVAYRKRKGKKK
jgi:hypothetical protein